MYFKEWMRDLSIGFNEIACKLNDQSVDIEAACIEAKKIMNAVKINFKKIVISDASLITCISNDFGYENVFSKPLDVLLNEEDVLVALSDSGESLNVLNSVKIAKEKKCRIITLSAFEPINSLFSFQSHLAFHVPTKNYSIAEVAHLSLLHAWVDELAGVMLG